jgi:hypothetical protein
VDRVEALLLKIKSQEVDIKELLKKQQWEKPLRHYLKGLRALFPS